MVIIPTINVASTKITIGVKSTGPILVGTYFLTVLYIGSITSPIALGLSLSQNNWSHDKITSTKMIIAIKSSKIINIEKINVIIFI